jgi:hypothetical protein
MINRSPTPIEIVSAATTRRDVFATMPAGLAAVDNSDMAVEDTFFGYQSCAACLPRHSAMRRTADSRDES